MADGQPQSKYRRIGEVGESSDANNRAANREERVVARLPENQQAASTGPAALPPASDAPAAQKALPVQSVQGSVPTQVVSANQQAASHINDAQLRYYHQLANIQLRLKQRLARPIVGIIQPQGPNNVAQHGQNQLIPKEIILNIQPQPIQNVNRRNTVQQVNQEGKTVLKYMVPNQISIPPLPLPEEEWRELNEDQKLDILRLMFQNSEVEHLPEILRHLMQQGFTHEQSRQCLLGLEEENRLIPIEPGQLVFMEGGQPNKPLWTVADLPQLGRWDVDSVPETFKAMIPLSLSRHRYPEVLYRPESHGKVILPLDCNTDYLTWSADNFWFWVISIIRPGIHTTYSAVEKARYDGSAIIELATNEDFLMEGVPAGHLLELRKCARASIMEHNNYIILKRLFLGLPIPKHPFTRL